MVAYFRTFDSPCYKLKDRDPKGKFDTRSDDGIFVGYSTKNCACEVYNTRTKTIVESINVTTDDLPGDNNSFEEEASDELPVQTDV